MADEETEEQNMCTNHADTVTFFSDDQGKVSTPDPENSANQEQG